MTILSLVPGAGLLAAGRRRVGAVLLTLTAVALAGLAAFVLTGDAAGRALRLAVRPRDLLVIAVLVGAVALFWCLTIVATALAAKPVRPSGFQTALAAVLVVALCVAVIAPSSVGVRYALIQRDLVTSLFADGGPAPLPGAATPDVEKKDPWASTPRVNLLLLGSDAGADRTGIRTDSMMVASIDTKTGDTLLFGIPRSLQNAPFPEKDPLHKVWPNGFNCGSECLLNAVWSQAEAHRDLFPGDPRPGLTAIRDVIGEILGLPIDYYTIIDLKGFQSLVDAMGGVTVNVPRNIPIGGGKIDGTNRERPITGTIPKGRHHLNGYEALWFSRSRTGADDYDRMKRQRCMVSALLDQTNPVQLLQKYPKLASVAKHNISTDVRQQDLEAWVDLVERIQNGTIRSLPLTNQVISTVHPDFEAIHALVQDALHSSPAAAPTSTATATTPSTTRTSSPNSGGGTRGDEKPDLTKPQDFAAVC
ncbi:MAG TPA: LCP family protein [Actinomycetales bacterium]|nr:LCP family protein [Actinomycetales bacterium]